VKPDAGSPGEALGSSDADAVGSTLGGADSVASTLADRVAGASVADALAESPVAAERHATRTTMSVMMARCARRSVGCIGLQGEVVAAA
jgi:hypothetical protein